MTTGITRACLVTCLAVLGCAAHASEPATEMRTLVDQSAWINADLTDDPLRSHQPPTVTCGVAGWYVEYGQLEIDTGRCNYAWVEHPALVAVPRGAEISTILTHFDLEAPEPAEAHVAILFGDEIQWETTVAIPQPGNVLELTWEATVAAQVGDPIRVHLHNHGQNFWSLEALMARVPVSHR